MDDPLHIKLVVVGDDITRDITSPKPRNLKTELLIHYASNSSPRGSITTSVDNYHRVNVTVNGQPAVLELYDTSGQAEYDRLRPLSYSNTNLFMLVFSVVHDTSFENISIKWFPEVSHFCPAVPIILVGINTHKRNKPSVIARISNQGDKIISPDMGEDLKSTIGAAAYRECSASTGVGIKETFETALTVAWLSMKEGKKPSSIAKNPKILPIREVYSNMLNEAYSAGDLDAMCNVRDAQDQSDLNVKDATETKIEFEILQRIRHETKGLALRRCNFKSLTNYFVSQFKQLDVLDLSRNLLSDAFDDAFVWKLIVLDLSRNYFTSFPIKLELFPSLKILSLAHNYIKEIPPSVAEFHKLELDVSHNLIENLHPSLLNMNLDATGNPFTGILPEYRMDPDKISMYLRNIQSQSAVGWKQVKLMLVGQEAVGKTTLLRAMQKEKLTNSRNVSTNGVNIAHLTLEHSAPVNLFNLFTKKQIQQEQQVRFSVWDFGGQSVFHSTHRLFITPFALYVVLYDMSKPETRERVRYWIEQIGDDIENTKPILIVGTHADLLTKEERAQLIQEMETLYPTPNRVGNAKIQGHCAVSLLHSEKNTLIELTNKLVDLALDHPKIGVRHVKVPKCIEALQTTLESIKSEKQYLRWSEYVTVCKKLGIPEEYIQDNATILHDTGAIVWHNVPKLRDTVIIDPQWLADAMSGVVSFMCQSAVALTGGITSWQKIKESLRLKFPDSMHLTAISMLEFFEIIYKMRASKILKVDQRNNDEQMFFVPSLLYPFEKGQSHPALQYWDMMETSHTFVRRFSWKFFPAGFFPRLLLRLVHLRLRPLVCWLDAAIISGTDGHECAFMLLSRESENDPFVLEVRVKVKEVLFREVPLVAELAYIISQLHQDMYPHYHSHDALLVHQIVVPHRNSVISFESCIKAEIEGKQLITVDGQPLRINQFLPDLSGCKQIPATAIQILEKIGKGGFGEVYQGIMKSEDVDGTGLSILVALKELQQMEDSRKFYDFQHEVMIMSKLNHINLVHLYGIIKSPLRMVMEYIPNSDLHSLLKQRQVLSFKLRLKIAIDCASGVSYLHSQSPAICHNDLRAPNLFIASLDENEEVIAKVADFGLSRQLFPYAQKALHNLMETAPETWEGDPYDEKSDVFSFAVILWRLFGTKSQNGDAIENPNDEDEVAESEREYLKENGKYCPPPKQRDIIRKGGRPPIHVGCPRGLKSLIKKCWHISPDSRPSITNILRQLMSTYLTYFSEDNYLILKRKEIDEEEHPFRQPNLSEYVFKHSAFKSKNWKPVNSDEFGAAPTTVLRLPTEVWFGTPMGGLAMFDKESTQFMQYKVLPTSESPGSRRATKRTILLSTGDNCIWAALGAEIHIISTLTRDVITLPLQNTHPVTAMVLLPLKYIWVADTEGFISIWDAQTLQKCYRFRVHPQDCAQTMTVLHNYVCMGVGRKLIAVHIHTLDIINAVPAHGDRIHDILAVPHRNQVWTCTRDGCVSAWNFYCADLSSPPPPSSSLSPPSRARSPSSPAPSRVPTSPPSSPPLSPSSPRALVRSTRGSALLLPKEINIPARRNTVSSSQPSIPSSPPKVSFAPLSPLPQRPLSPVADPPAPPQTTAQATSPPLPPKPSPSSPIQLAPNSISVQMRFNTNLKTPAKCACILSDGGHVCVGTFDGSIYVWNVQTFEQHIFPMPDVVKGHNIPCIIDTEYGLWCSVEDIQHPLMFHRHSVLAHQNEVLPCSTHGRKFHDAFINYKFFYEGSKSLVSPVEALYNSLSMQQKKKSIGDVTVFWDEKCHPYGQSWEHSFFHTITTSKVIILLISAQTLEGIKKNALNKQDNVLVEYECAIMQNKLHKTPVIPVFVAGAQKDSHTGEIVFTPFDFKDLDPALFPRSSHARSEDVQFIIDSMSKPMGSNDKKFLKSIGATIEQLGKLQGYLLLKRGTDEQELQKIVDQVMEELER